jgi:hypothetical protein
MRWLWASTIGKGSLVVVVVAVPGTGRGVGSSPRV